MPCGKADDLWSSTIYHDSVVLALPLVASADVTCKFTMEGITISVGNATAEDASEQVKACKALWLCDLLDRCHLAKPAEVSDDWFERWQERRRQEEAHPWAKEEE